MAIAHGLWRGGAQEFVLEMLVLLKRTGADITVLTSNEADRSFIRDLRNLEVSTFTVASRLVANYPDMAIEKHSSLFRSSDVVWISDVEYLAAPKVKRIRRDIPVVAHLHSFALVCSSWSGLYGLRETCTQGCSMQRIIRCKQLYNQRLFELGSLGRPKTRIYELLDFVKGPVDFLKWPINSRIIESIDGYVAVSRSVRDLILLHLPQLKRLPIEVIHNPVVVPMLRTDRLDQRNHFVALYASGPNLLKGPHIVLYATRKLVDKGLTKFKLIMVRAKGDALMERYVRKLNLEKHVELLPELKRERLYQLMTDCDLVLMPSVWPEPFGRIPVEANKLGTPAIVSNTGALPEVIVDKVTGLVAEPTVEAFCEAIVKASRTKWNRSQIVDVTRARFDPDRIVKSFLQFLQRFA